MKIGTVERLVGVHNTNVCDWLTTSVGATLPNGTARLPASGSADANGAWIEGLYVLGNGTDANLRVNDASGTSDLATQFTFASSQYLSHATNASLETGDVDFTVAAWVYLDTISADRPIMARWDNGTSSLREYRLWYDQASGKMKFEVWNFSGPTFAIATSTATITTGTWYFVVGQHDSVNDLVSCQVNNGTAGTAAHSTGITANTVDFMLGRLQAGTTYMDGRIERAGFWKSAASGGGVLSAGLKTSIYNAGVGKAYSSLTAGEKVALISYWNLGSTYTDSVVANANDLTQHNTPTTSAGVDYAIVVAELMPDAPTTNLTLVTAVGTGHPAGDYSYLVSYVTADGNYTATNPTAVDFTAGGNVDISVQSIPIPPAGHDITGRAIWRLSGGSLFYKLAHVITDITTTVWIDTVADVDLGAELNLFNAKMPPIKYSCEHNSRWIGCGNAADKQTVFISNKFEPWYCPESPDTEDPLQGTRAKLQGRAAGEGLGVCSHGAYVAVFTGGAGYFLTGDEPLDFALTKFCDHGCVAHRTIKSVRGLLIWLAPDGVYAWMNGAATRISDDQRTTIEAISAADMAAAYAWVYDDKWFLGWPSGCLYVDLAANFPRQWGTLTNNLWTTATVTVNTASARQKVYAARSAHARVYQLETGATDAIPTAGTAIATSYATKDWDMGLPTREKRACYIEVKAKKSTGTLTITLYKGSGDDIQTETHDLSTVDDSAETVTRAFKSCNEYARSEYFRVKVDCSTTAAELELIAVGLQWMMAS